MPRLQSLQVIVVLSLLLNTASAAAPSHSSLSTSLDAGSVDQNNITFNTSGSAGVVGSHFDSVQIISTMEGDRLASRGGSVTATALGSGVTSRISIASDGAQGDGTSGVPRISANGRYVVFSSQARNLVSGDTNSAYDIFVHDRETGQTTRVSVTSGGGQGDGPSFVASISADGRYVAFRSMATNLVVGDTNNQDDVFLHDRDTQETIRISVGPGGVEGDGPSIKPAISADGKYVAFESWATNLVNGDNNGREDVFLYDRQARQVTRVSVAPGGAEANDESDLPALSADGRYMAFASQASNLVAGDNNNVCDTNNDGIFTENCPDVFVYERDTGHIQRVSVGTGGTQSNGWSATSSLSADGRYVAFESQAQNLVIGDNNGVYDVFVHDRQTSQTWRVSVDPNGREGNGESVSPAISADGRYVAFVSRADNLVVGDTNGTDDVFVHDRETRRTIRVSVATDGRQGFDSSDNPALSVDGRYVAFASLASNLVNGDTNGQKDVFVRDRGAGLGNTMTIPLVSGSDDAGVEMSCVYRPDWKEIYLGRCNDGSSIVSGFRFRGVQIAAGAVISEAYLELTVDGTYSNDIASQIFGQASANSAPFSDTDRPSDRPVTTNFVNWNIPASDVWSVGQSRRSPDLTSIVQEIVNLPGWDSGNSLTIILRANPAVAENTHRRVFAWERGENSDHTARLVVTFRGGATIPPTTTFLDVPLDHWAHDAIETLYQAGVTAACSRDPLMYCPDSSMNRAESAMFVEHGIHGIGFIPTQPITQVFADVPLNSWAAKWATAVWTEGYTAGCDTNPLRYCPWQTYTRAEGSVLYLRMLNGTGYVPPDPAGIFADVPIDQWYARWAEAAYTAGLIRACQTSPQLRFCPNDPMTRAMSAYALSVAKNLHDTTPPDGRITFPTNGSTIGPDTTSVFIRADAWDNPGGSGVAKVRFYVEYDGVRNHVCTDQDANPSCRWSIPAGLASQQLVFTINVVDRAGNIKENAGGPVYVNYQADGDGGGRDTTPPDGRITSPPDGYTIPFGTGSVLIRAEAWDNQGGSGVASVVFYVEYEGVRHRVCTKNESTPSCTWSIPAGFAPQTLVFTIDVTDQAGNMRADAGGPVYVDYGEVPPSLKPRLTASPASVPADGTSRSTITLSNAPVGHRVQLISSRGSVDAFANAMGTVNSSGQFVTTIRSSTRGTAKITAKDLTTNEMFAPSVSIDFTPSDPTPTDEPVITDVKGDCGRIDCPKDGFFMLGLNGLRLPLRVTVDWKGQPGTVEFSINDHTDSVQASGQSVRYELDINQYLREGSNVLQIKARSGSTTSKPWPLDLYGYRLPQWITDGVKSLPVIGDQVLVLEVTFPGQLLSKQKPIDWGFPGDKNQFQWQVSIKVSLPTRGGPFEVEIKCLRNRDSTGTCPGTQAFLKLLGQKFGLEYYGKLSGVLRAAKPYVIVQEAEIGGSISKEFKKDVGIIVALNALTPFGPVAYQVISKVPAIRDWINDRAKFYVKITPELFGKFTLAFQPNFHIAAAQIGLDVPVEVGAKADLWVVEGHIYGGLGGKGTFGYSADDLRIASLKAYGFGGYKFRLAWFSIEDRGDWKLKEWPAGSGHLTLMFLDATQHSSKWQLIGHSASDEYAFFHAQPDMRQAFASLASDLQPTDIAAQTTVTSVLVSNVYTYTEPSLAVNTGNNNALWLWVHDDMAKPVGQSHEIYFSRWNGSSWSVPAGVTNDRLLDGAPQVAWANGGRAVAIWQRLDDTLPITATWDVTTANQIEIATATYNPASGTWSPISLLASNGALDLTPRLARNKTGRLLAAWRQNPAGSLSGDPANPDRIMTAFYDSGWSAPAVAVPNIPGLVDLAAGYGDGTANIAFTQYVTPTGYSTPTLQLFTTSWHGGEWSTPLQRTDDTVGHRNPQVVYNTANQPLVVWLAGGELRLRNLATGGIVDLVLPAEIGSIDEFRIVQDAAGNIAAVFTAQASQRDLYVAFYDQVHNLWGNPTRLTEDRASEAYPAPALDSTGRLLMGYSTTAITSITRTATISETGEVITFTVPSEGQTDLLTLSHVFTRNLTLNNAGLSVLDFHPAPGNNAVVLSAAVHNSGDLALDGVAVSFYDGNPSSGGTLIGTAALTEPLAAGFTATLTRTYSVPATGGVRAIYAVADPANAIAEADETDNSASLAAFGPDLEIVTAGVDYWGGSQVGLQTIIHNIGPSAAPATTLAFYRTALTGTLAVTDSVPALAPDETVTINTPWNFGALPAGGYPFVAAVNRASFTEVFTANNIYTFTLDVRPDLMVSPYYLWTTSPTGTTVLVTATVFNVGAITATNVTVGFYGDDRLNDGSPLITQTVPLLGPAGSATLSGQVAGPLDCTLYVYADPAGAIAETTRTNNLAGIDYRSLCQRVYLPLVLRNH